ncbi:BrnA antitoxin family protein [Nitrospirillum amazonense]|uniref:BrnA antitoxin family protein n=1 Tax=Nitrospirillum amazonense TaxID=28077 RepID=UPI002412ABCA|nr:BrnA antitoxin family protein [Nitrospirillum amazonense]MDG3443710.1 BrnA antitoxin family protein [Nitrospirillum amazonense]
MKKGNPAPISAKLLAELDELDRDTRPIDTSDAPEITDFSGGQRGRFFRPVKVPLSLRLDADVLDWFKRQGAGYQGRINDALRQFIDSQREVS